MRLIPAGNLEQAEPVLPIRWCLEPREGLELEEQKAENIHILFVIAYQPKDGRGLEDRHLVPIDQMMTFLSFRRPGRHLVLAKIVWGKDEDLEDLTKMANFSTYYYDLLDRARTDFDTNNARSSFWNLKVQCLNGRAEVEVAIPAEHFPKKWPGWLKYLAECGYQYPSFDQCHTKKRLAFAPVKLLFFGLWAVITTAIRIIIATFLTLCAMREIDYEAILHPFRDDIGDVSSDVHRGRPGSWILHDKDNNLRSEWLFLLHPMIYFGIFVGLTGAKIHSRTTYFALVKAIWFGVLAFALAIWNWLISLPWIMITATAIGVAISVFLIWKIGKSKARRRERTAQEIQEAIAKAKRTAYDELYQLLACRAEPMVADVSALPRERQTLRLKYLRVKVKLCRPWAV